MYIVSLAVADLIVGVFVMPISTVYIFTKSWRFGVAVCQIWIAIDYTASTASILNLFILSVDRYWSVTSPLRYLRKRTKKRAFIMISIVWMISSLWIIPIVGWHYFAHGGVRTVPEDVCDTEYAKDSIFKVITAFFNFFLPLAVMYSLYGKVFHEIRKRSALELGQTYPNSTIHSNYQDYMTEGDSPVRESSCSDHPINTFTEDHPNSLHIDESNYYVNSKATSLNKEILNSKHFQKAAKGNKKCVLLKSRKQKLRVPNGERTHLNQRCNVEYIYDESVMDSKTERLERYYYEEHIPMTIRSRDVVVNPCVCQETPSLSSHSSGPSTGSDERRSMNGSKHDGSQMKSYSLASGIRQLRRTEQILDNTVSMTRINQRQVNSEANRNAILFRDADRGRYSSKLNVKHRIKHFRQTSSLTREIKAARQLGVIMGAFTLCFLPYFTLFLIVAFCHGCVDPELMTATTWIGYLNSTLNPFLYPLCNTNFRRKFRKLLRLDRKKKRRKRNDFTVDGNSFTMRYD
ncbi:hypothetical protein FSP39_006303 [Pinctada imbricata]|uniref:G-protein coupled receptors family 1 profile domain-containing protein n=1 Tax=Pinctada imbricata TaxID=66713 RepID=A0AA88YBF8_PINIB|nr:hypothetical protein FSP39_006303 [Pinctada imbricata]